MKTHRVLAILVLLASAAAAPRRAEACGGCFAPPETITNVESHRMVISLSLERTTLWDQIRYSGDPRDFVWVLPVPTAAATIEVADPIFFEELEAQTAPRISAPPLPPGPSCPPPPDGFGGWAQDAGLAAPDAGGVTVYHEEVVGPYQTVTIGSEDAGALQAWLDENGYRIPESTIPIIAWYVERGSVFVVMRLAPDEGVSAMQPVRVRYPGYMATFPLRMVSVGASGALDLTLWVVADQRFGPRNYAEARVREADLVWDWARGGSNYAERFAAALDEAGGRAWVAEFAQPLSSLWFTATAEADVARVDLPAPFLTRLRTELLVDYLDQDLELAPAFDASWISPFLQAPTGINPPPPPTCPDWDGDGDPDSWADAAGKPARDVALGCRVGSRGGAIEALAALALVALLVAVRRRR